MIRERRKAHVVAWLWLAPILALVLGIALASTPPAPAEPASNAPGAEAG
jgi:hypothetical protein